MKHLGMICGLALAAVILSGSRVEAQVVGVPGANQGPAAARKIGVVNPNIYRLSLHKRPLGAMPQRQPIPARQTTQPNVISNNINPALFNRTAVFGNSLGQGMFPGANSMTYPNLFGGNPYFNSGMYPGMMPGAFQNRFIP